MNEPVNFDPTRIPAHVAIIMDGNGRWAKARGLERTAGHVEGVESVRTITTECVRLGVKFLTLYTFSTENWNRPAAEIKALMELILTSLEEEIFIKNTVRFNVIGDIQRLPEEVQRRLKATMERTKDYDRMVFTVALSYSSRWEITEAVKHLAAQVKSGAMQIEDVTEDTVSQSLTTAGMPDPDLLIRTGGEVRLSNYLLWQCAYSELYFCDTFWPDFREPELHRAIAAFQKKERRYGMTSEQVTDQQS